MERACILLSDTPQFENMDYVLLSRVGYLDNLMILDDHLSIERFITPTFYRGWDDQIHEYRRLGINKEVLGECDDDDDEDEEDWENLQCTTQYATEPSKVPKYEDISDAEDERDELDKTPTMIKSYDVAEGPGCSSSG